jgi:hypothetical protein
MGQNMACLGLRGTARSRQDESKEVHEAGRIQRPSGGKGGHVLSLHPLIWRSLGLGVVTGARRNGPVWPRAQRTAGRRQHT